MPPPRLPPLPSEPLIRSRRPVTLVGGGPVLPERLAAALALAPEAIGADGGGDVALPGGARFRAVIGDMDSLRNAEALRASGVALHPIAEQNSTDLEKCLYSVAAPLFLGLGFLGGRLDHHLAAMNALARRPDKRVLLIGREDICFRCPRELRLAVTVGTRVSLFPMGPVRGAIGEGLRWPVQGLDFAPDGRIGTSNAALGGVLRLGFGGGPMLVILPVDYLAAAAAALGAAR